MNGTDEAMPQSEAQRRALAQDRAGEPVEVVAPVTAKEYKHMMSLRIDPEVARALRMVARDRQTTVSELLREAALRIIDEHETAHYEVRFVERPAVTGLALVTPYTSSSTGYGLQWTDSVVTHSA